MRETAPLEHETSDPLNELAETLVLASALISQLKRAAEAAALRVDFGAIDEAFARSIALARTVRERILKRGRAEYASLTSVAREVVGRVQENLPAGLAITGRFTAGAAIVSADPAQLRRVVLAMLETALHAIAGKGSVEVEVVDTAPLERARRALCFDVRTSAELEEGDPRIARLRPLALAVGGTLQIRSPIRGGTAISLRLLAAN